ncbi:MAG: hypothetical protein JWO02_1853 [Solirubrobacterales bacterium]|nr:hypothetical protein [Solirubrobacterales bacterium]
MATQTASTAVRRPTPELEEGQSLTGLQEVGELARFSVRALRALPGTFRYFSELMRQAAILAKGTTPFVFSLAIFLGMSVASFGYFFLRSLGGTDALGVVTGAVDPRLATPVIFGYAFTSKVCTGIVAEIGSMKVQQEVEALESTGLDSMHYIVGTRLMAALFYAPVASAVCLLGTTGGSWLISTQILKGISSDAFLSLNWDVQTLTDQLYATIAVFVIALFTTMTACFYGFRATSGPASVGAAAARSLVVNLILVHLIAAFFGVLFYGTDVGIPIGG